MSKPRAYFEPWFAWHPVYTEDAGWRWLTSVYRRLRAGHYQDHWVYLLECK